MAFTCDCCGQPQTACAQPIITPVAVREVHYQVKPKTAKRLGLSRKFPYTKGIETVMEARLCEQCFSPNFMPILVKGKAKRVNL